MKTSEHPTAALAAYTSPPSGQAGYRWIWSDASLEQVLLDEAYAAACRKLPGNVSSLSADDLHAGVLLLRNGAVAAFYRFLDGGRDALGRQGRFFLVMAFLDSGTACKADAEELFMAHELNTVHDLKSASTRMDVPMLSSTRSPSRTDIHKLENDGRLSLSGPGSVRSLAGLLAPECGFSSMTAFITGKMGNPSIEVQVVRGGGHPEISPAESTVGDKAPLTSCPTSSVNKRVGPGFMVGFVSGFAAGAVVAVVIIGLILLLIWVGSTGKRTEKPSVRPPEPPPPVLQLRDEKPDDKNEEEQLKQQPEQQGVSEKPPQEGNPVKEDPEHDKTVTNSTKDENNNKGEVE